MRAPPVPEVMSALLASVVTWAAWPWWSTQADAWLPTVPSLLGFAAAYAAFRLVLTPARAAFAWGIAASIPPSDHPAE